MHISNYASIGIATSSFSLFLQFPYLVDIEIVEFSSAVTTVTTTRYQVTNGSTLILLSDNISFEPSSKMTTSMHWVHNVMNSPVDSLHTTFSTKTFIPIQSIIPTKRNIFHWHSINSHTGDINSELMMRESTSSLLLFFLFVFFLFFFCLTSPLLLR